MWSENCIFPPKWFFYLFAYNEQLILQFWQLKKGSGGKWVWSTGSTETKTSPKLKQNSSKLPTSRVLCKTAHPVPGKTFFLTHLHGKGWSHIFKISAFQMRSTCDKGCFQALFFTQPASSHGKPLAQALQLTRGCLVKDSHNSQLLIMQTTWGLIFLAVQ